jgi:hypothetical protein
MALTHSDGGQNPFWNTPDYASRFLKTTRNKLEKDVIIEHMYALF